jgi:hypothetical protein
LKVEHLFEGDSLHEFLEGGGEASGTVGANAGGESGVGVFVTGDVEGVEDKADC